MNFFKFHALPRQIYQAFILDSRRIYLLLPRPLRFKFWAVFASQFISAFTETCTLLVISVFAVSVAAPEMALNNPIIRGGLALVPSLADFCADHRRLVILTSLLMTAFILFKVVTAALVIHQSARFAESVTLHIGREALRRYLNRGYFWHLTSRSQSVLNKFSQRAQLSYFLVSLLEFYSKILCCLALFISLFLAEPRLTVSVVSIFSAASLLVYLFLRRRVDSAGQKLRDLGVAESADRLTLARGLREILLNRRQGAFFKKMSETLAQYAAPKIALAFYGNLPSQVLELVGFVTVSLLTVCLLVAGVPMSVIVSSVSLLMLTAWRVLPAASRAMGLTVTLRGLRPAALTCLELLETFVAEEPETQSEPDPNFSFEKNLILREATFSYPGQESPALNALSLTVAKGETLGLIGPSGVGKSTLALLLTGLVPLPAGQFYVDGRELAPAGRAAYLRLVGFVPQSPLLMPGTLADNVAFSCWGEKYDRGKVAEVCRQAAMDFAFNHPQGLDQRLAGGAQDLSGGQAQRVAIARALFTGPEIIIFDEATSALDQSNENIIAATIKKLPAETTVIIIAHRLTTVENCDRLVWLEDGRVWAEGPPAEILPRYRSAMAAKTVAAPDAARGEEVNLEAPNNAGN